MNKTIGDNMQKRTPWSFQISDLVQWYGQNQIILSPKYQRNIVWNENAKSYLMDTIVRGLPIPPIFLRQKVDINTKTTVREIIDGQQRIRTILDYVVTELFSIKKTHNKEVGGLLFSELDERIQEDILSYQISAEVVTENDESIIYDMFARLNANNIVLNRQEIRNAKYWGEFKIFAYSLASTYRDFFLEQKLLSEKEFSRMRDAELISSLLILILEGIVDETPQSVDKIYAKYDADIPERDKIENQFAITMDYIRKIYSFFNFSIGPFDNKNYFFTLFGVIYHQLFGIKKSSIKREIEFSADRIKNEKSFELLLKGCSLFISDFEKNTLDTENAYGFYADYMVFVKNHKSRTTNKTERIQRIKFLNDKLLGYIK